MRNPTSVEHDAAWRARIAIVLSGALRVWAVPAAVRWDAGAEGFLIAPAAGPQVLVRREGRAWIIELRDPASGACIGCARHAGMPGVLRRLRDELAPDAPAGRLRIGAQPLFGGR